MTDFSQVTGYKINIRNQINGRRVFFTIVTKKTTFLVISLIRNVQFAEDKPMDIPIMSSGLNFFQK